MVSQDSAIDEKIEKVLLLVFKNSTKDFNVNAVFRAI